MKIDIFKPIRLRRIDKARERAEREREEEGKRIAEAKEKEEREKKERESRQRLEEVLSKVLTISARDYCKIYGKNITYYEVKGVHTLGHEVYYIEDFAKEIPPEAEVVVKFQQTTGGKYRKYMASGTALIPKKKKQ